MARIPTRRDLGVSPLPSAVPQPFADGEVFGGDRGLTQLASGISIVADDIQQEEDRRQREIERSEDFQANIATQKFLSDQALTLDEDAENMQAGGAGFSQSQLDRFDQGVDELVNQFPERLREPFRARLSARRSTFAAQADNFEDRERERFNQSALDGHLDGLMADVARDPDNADGFVQAGLAAIESSPLPQRLKADAKREWRASTAKRQEAARIGSDVEYAKVFVDPERRDIAGKLIGAAKSAGIDPAFILGLVNHETGGTFSSTIRPIDADGNELSTAVGLGQFIDGTWEAEGGGDRLDPDEQVRVLIQHTARNKKALTEKLGRAPSNAELYAAHHNGLEGALMVLERDPSDSMSAIMGTEKWQQISKANSLPSDMTGGEYIQWSARNIERSVEKFGGLASRGIESISGLDASGVDTGRSIASRLIKSELDELEDAAQDAIKAAEQERELQKDRALMELRVAMKDGADVEAQVRELESDRIITPDEATPLIVGSRSNIRKAEEQQQETATRQSMLSDHLGGRAELNPFSKDHRNAVSDQFNDVVGENATFFGNDGEATRQSALSHAISFGIAPKQATNAIRGALAQTDPARMLEGIQLARVMQGNAPTAFAGQDGAAQIARSVAQFNRFTEEYRYSPQEAVEQMILRAGEGRKMARDKKAELAKTHIETLEPDDLEDKFDGDLGFNEAQRDVMFGQYVARLQSEIIQWGDVEIATANTDEAFISTPASPGGFGVTEVSGRDTVMENPPENFYPEIDGSHDWLRNQVEREVATKLRETEATEDVDIDRVDLVNMTGNRERIARGQDPIYGVWVQGEVNGEPIHMMLEDGFRFSPFDEVIDKAVTEVEEFVEDNTITRSPFQSGPRTVRPTTDEIFDEFSGEGEDRESREKFKTDVERNRRFQTGLRSDRDAILNFLSPDASE